APGTQVAAGVHAEAVEPGRGDLAHTEDLLYRQRGDEGVDVLRADDELAVGLVPVARHLGDELVGGNACRGGDADLVMDAGADLLRHQRSRATAAVDAAYVQIGLVERQRLDQRRVVAVDGKDAPRGLTVAFEIGRQQD